MNFIIDREGFAIIVGALRAARENYLIVPGREDDPVPYADVQVVLKKMERLVAKHDKYLAKLEESRERGRRMLALHEEGSTRSDLATAFGIGRARVDQVLVRARRLKARAKRQEVS